MTVQTILIVEDDLDFAGQLRTVLEHRGHVVVVALTGGDGIGSFRERPADSVIVDIKLPDAHGLRVVESIRSLPGGADVPVYLMSAVYRRPELFEKDMGRLGIESFLAKPFSFDDLSNRLETLLAQEEAGRKGVRDRLAKGKEGSGMAYARADSSPAPLAPALAGENPEGRLSAEDTMVRIDSARRLPRSGRLTPETYVRILTMIFHSHSCGRLICVRGQKRRTIYLLNGYPIWAEGPTPQEGVLRFLRVEGVLDGPMAEKIAGDLEGGSSRLSSLVMAAAGLEQEEFDDLMEDWVSQEVRNALRHDGGFEFSQSDDFAGQVPVHEVNPITTLWEGLESGMDRADLARSMEELSSRTLGRTRSFAK
ncbi:MAG: response regulator, partial [Myxococcota bacterium]|nr:response regulator [Myxococcota bacterium]